MEKTIRISPNDYRQILQGIRNFLILLGDRNPVGKAGDIITVIEQNPNGTFTGFCLKVELTAVWNSFQHNGIKMGYYAINFKLLEELDQENGKCLLAELGLIEQPILEAAEDPH